jgi:predicted transcriptional regulator of viral defense system
MKHQTKTDTRTQQILRLAKEQGMIRLRDMETNQIPHSYLRRLLHQGVLVRSGRGIYIPADSEPDENFSLAEACKRVPDGVICLLSALRFHHIGTQHPFEVWIAIPQGTWTPKVDYPPLHIVRLSGQFLLEGIEEHKTATGPVRVYSVAKTVVDCFRFRNRIGIDVALEALRECRRSRRATVEEIWHYAKILRVSTVIKPYLEVLE